MEYMFLKTCILMLIATSLEFIHVADSMRPEEPSPSHNPETDADELRASGVLTGKLPIPRNSPWPKVEGMINQQMPPHSAVSFSELDLDTVESVFPADKVDVASFFWDEHVASCIYTFKQKCCTFATVKGKAFLLFSLGPLSKKWSPYCGCWHFCIGIVVMINSEHSRTVLTGILCIFTLFIQGHLRAYRQLDQNSTCEIKCEIDSCAIID